EQQNTSAAVVPPPNSVRPPRSLESPDQQQSRVDHRTSNQHSAASGGFHIPRAVILAGTYGGLPVLALGCGCLLVVRLKGLRRRRRRKRGAPSTQGAAGWREIVDYARDLGRAVPAGQTRTEDARTLGQLDLEPLAASADAVVFGPGQPSPGAATWYWSEIERARRHIGREMTRWQRLRAPNKLRSPRAPKRPRQV